jgi:hypothetical protein
VRCAYGRQNLPAHELAEAKTRAEYDNEERQDDGARRDPDPASLDRKRYRRCSRGRSARSARVPREQRRTSERGRDGGDQDDSQSVGVQDSRDDERHAARQVRYQAQHACTCYAHGWIGPEERVERGMSSRGATMKYRTAPTIAIPPRSSQGEPSPCTTCDQSPMPPIPENSR